MKNYADRLVSAIHKKGNPCVVGLDPRLNMMPDFVTSCSSKMEKEKAIQVAITNFHRIILDVVSPLVPAVKLQIAFYEQYGIPGLLAFADTIQIAKKKGLIVIVDAKRNDIASTAEAYANAFLGKSTIFGSRKSVFDIDCITVSPFLGRDSLEPFVKACTEYGKGIFILVKTSNPGSVDIQDQKLVRTGEPLYEDLAKMVNDLAVSAIGESGYSSIGAVVGATFPHEAVHLRRLMPQSIILVPGYGAQGGNSNDVMPCFNEDGLGAVINSSRGITYAHRSRSISREEFVETVQSKLVQMIEEVTFSLRDTFRSKK